MMAFHHQMSGRTVFIKKELLTNLKRGVFVRWSFQPNRKKALNAHTCEFLFVTNYRYGV